MNVLFVTAILAAPWSYNGFVGDPPEPQTHLANAPSRSQPAASSNSVAGSGITPPAHLKVRSAAAPGAPAAPSAAAAAAVAAPAAAASAKPGGALDLQSGQAMMQKDGCAACHAVDKAVVGPAYRQVAAKYRGDKSAAAKLEHKVKTGGSGVWGPVPMPPNAAVSDADIKALVNWILTLGN